MSEAEGAEADLLWLLPATAAKEHMTVKQTNIRSFMTVS